MMILMLAYGTIPVAAWYETGEKGVTAEVNSYPIGKHGSNVEYGYSQGEYHSDTHPRFYASLMSIGDWGDNTPYYFGPSKMWIKVWGYKPNDQPLLGDEFSSLSVMVSPEESGAEQQVLENLWTFLGDISPEGLLPISYITKAAQGETGSATGRTTYTAYARYFNDIIYKSDSQRGMRFGFNLEVDPTLEGTYEIYFEFKTRFQQSQVYTEVTTTESLVYRYDDGESEGGGCPYLSVYDGTQYVTEELLSIHAEDDVTFGSRLVTTPATVRNKHYLRLTEHPQTISHIDSVQLFARLADGSVIELPLVYAGHSREGNVINLLKNSDDRRIGTLGANHNDGISEYIDLQFMAGQHTQVVEYVFMIEGYNAESKF